MIEPGNYSTITRESVEHLAHLLARRGLIAIERFKPIADFEELISFTTENPTPVEHSAQNPVWRLESVSSRLVEAIAISVHERTIRDAGWSVLAQIILEHTEYLYTYHQAHNPRERLQAGTSLALAGCLCANLTQSNAWRLAGFARIAESLDNSNDVPSYLIQHIDAAFELARELDLPIHGEAVDSYVTSFNCNFVCNKRTRFELSDNEFFNQLNLCCPGFGKVKSELKHGNLQEAKRAHTLVKQTFLNSKIWAKLWQPTRRPSAVNSSTHRSVQYLYADATRQKWSKEVNRQVALECLGLFFSWRISPKCRGVMSFDVAKSFLERSRYFSAHQGLDKADFHLETSIMGIAALLLPEWRDRAQFLTLVLRRFKWIHYDHILPDGLQNDSANTGHYSALSCLLSFHQLAGHCGFPLPTHIDRCGEKMIEALMYLSRPDTLLLPLNQCESREIGVGELCDIGHAVFHREDFLYMASRGGAGVAPNETSRAFPHSGYYVMRDDWSADAQYLVFDGGDPTLRNQRGDKLNFNLYAFGRPLIVNADGFLTDGRGSDDSQSSRMHNTVIIDGNGQRRSARHRAAQGPNRDVKWLTTPVFDYVEGWHKDGYVCGGWNGYNPYFIHKRSVFFPKKNAQSRGSFTSDGEYFILHDMILGEGEHTLEQIFHLPPMSCNHVRVYDNNTVCTMESNQSNLVVAPACGARQLDVRLQCSEFESLVGRTVSELPPSELIFRALRSLPTVINTVLFPLRPGQETVPQLRMIEVFAEPDVLATGFTVTHNSTTDLVLISGDGFAVMSTCDAEFVGEYLFLRQDAYGKPQRIVIINGQFMKWRGKVLVELPETQAHYASSICGE